MTPGVFLATAEDADVIAKVRGFVSAELHAAGCSSLVDDAVLVASELATNAVLHAGGLASVHVTASRDAVRIEVRDRTRVPPMLALVSADAMTGRGLRMVAAVATRWGVEPEAEGKVVWAELNVGHTAAPIDVDDLLDFWSDDAWDDAELAPARYPISLSEVPTDLLLAAKSHVDNLVREFTLAAGGAMSGVAGDVPPHLAALIDTVVSRFAEARQSIKRQAVAAATAGNDHVRLELSLPASAADAGEEYLRGLDEADTYARAARLLTLETPPQHRVFRHWYVGELVRQLRAAVAGEPRPTHETFEQRLLRELDAVADAHRASERTARLVDVTAALAVAATPEAVARAVLERGVAALGAFGGGLLLATDADVLAVPATVGYDEQLVERLRSESRDADLPAAVALRTGESVWIESRDQRDTRFPELAQLERFTVSLCAVPLTVGDRRLGALRFSFAERRLFGEEERRFVHALAGQAAQALERAQLYEQLHDTSRRLQRSLLPGSLPEIAGVDIAAAYHPLGHGMELGGDFYDVWALDENRWAFAIGDASGTGPEAAALTAMVRFTLRALTTTHADPAMVLERLNEILIGAEASGAEGERFCTAMLGVLTTTDIPTIALASGGHPFPLLRHGDGRCEQVVVGGSLLGIFDVSPVASRTVTLHPGDALLLYTDGVIEARADGVEFGVEGLADAIATAPGADAAALTAAVEAAVLAHSSGVMEDDMAVLVVHAPAR